MVVEAISRKRALNAHATTEHTSSTPHAFVPPSKVARHDEMVAQASTTPLLTQQRAPQHASRLLHARIGVLWVHDAIYYKATVIDYNPQTCKHRVRYDDGHREWLKLSKEDFRWLLPRARSAGGDAEFRCGVVAAGQRTGSSTMMIAWVLQDEAIAEGASNLTPGCLPPRPVMAAGEQSPTGAAAVGRKVTLYCAVNGELYRGEVIAWDRSKQLHHVLYEDAEDEWVHLSSEFVTWPRVSKQTAAALDAGLGRGHSVPKRRAAVGWRIAVYRTREMRFVEALVLAFDAQHNMHRVQWQDGRTQALSLQAERVKWIFPPDLAAQGLHQSQSSESNAGDDGDEEQEPQSPILGLTGPPGPAGSPTVVPSFGAPSTAVSAAAGARAAGAHPGVTLLASSVGNACALSTASVAVAGSLMQGSQDVVTVGQPTAGQPTAGQQGQVTVQHVATAQVLRQQLPAGTAGPASGLPSSTSPLRSMQGPASLGAHLTHGVQSTLGVLPGSKTGPRSPSPASLHQQPSPLSNVLSRVLSQLNGQGNGSSAQEKVAAAIVTAEKALSQGNPGLGSTAVQTAGKLQETAVGADMQQQQQEGVTCTGAALMKAGEDTPSQPPAAEQQHAPQDEAAVVSHEYESVRQLHNLHWLWGERCIGEVDLPITVRIAKVKLEGGCAQDESALCTLANRSQGVLRAWKRQRCIRPAQLVACKQVAPRPEQHDAAMPPFLAQHTNGSNERDGAASQQAHDLQPRQLQHVQQQLVEVAGSGRLGAKAADAGRTAFADVVLVADALLARVAEAEAVLGCARTAGGLLSAVAKPSQDHSHAEQALIPQQPSLNILHSPPPGQKKLQEGVPGQGEGLLLSPAPLRVRALPYRAPSGTLGLDLKHAMSGCLGPDAPTTAAVLGSHPQDEMLDAMALATAPSSDLDTLKVLQQEVMQLGVDDFEQLLQSIHEPVGDPPLMLPPKVPPRGDSPGHTADLSLRAATAQLAGSSAQRPNAMQACQPHAEGAPGGPSGGSGAPASTQARTLAAGTSPGTANSTGIKDSTPVAGVKDSTPANAVAPSVVAIAGDIASDQLERLPCSRSSSQLTMQVSEPQPCAEAALAAAGLQGQGGGNTETAVPPADALRPRNAHVALAAGLASSLATQVSGAINVEPTRCAAQQQGDAHPTLSGQTDSQLLPVSAA